MATITVPLNANTSRKFTFFSVIVLPLTIKSTKYYSRRLSPVMYIFTDQNRCLKHQSFHFLFQAVQLVHETLGIAEPDICYVKNYKEELETERNKDTLIASVLKVCSCGWVNVTL